MTESTATPISHRQSLPLEPFDILARASAMGRTLVGVRAPGALLERIGVFDGVKLEGGLLVAENEKARTVIDPSVIASIVADVSETPHDTVLTYVDFLDADGVSVIKVTALEGPEKFNAALAAFARAPLPYVPPLPRTTVPVDSGDIGGVPLVAASASGAGVTLAVRRPGAEQSWTGALEAIKFGHSYVNVIQADVHLHLAARAVAAWNRAPMGDGIALSATDEAGQLIGLTVSGPRHAFEAVAETV
ncbi:Putative heme degradation protein [Kaistia soli DSM 19436]|uniref:Putative heme degradation protein n=1 Tax=Kaistia soli DSM 19436 TaxID=1122133 RepID=A0A1M5AH93_9HYPH|nr:hypothetical protein [Kaistia soli]SHF29631.1 Putative heme degradation protein [Kaistia soli DSM 19436]